MSNEVMHVKCLKLIVTDVGGEQGSEDDSLALQDVLVSNLL